MSNRNYMHWQKMADDGIIAYAHSGVPCNQNSAAPHIAQYLASCNSTANAAHTTTIRRGLHEHGPDGDASNETTRIRSALFHRTASICNSVARNGGIVTVETPSRRSDPARPDVYDERAKGHATVFETTPYATLKAQRDLCLATTENNSWKDAEGRNKAQKSSDWLMSPELYPTLGAALNAHRDACSPTQHEKSLGGKHADGTWRTTGEGAYPDELVQTVAFHVDVWRQAMNLTGSVTADGCLLPLQQRVEATMRVRGAKKAEALTGLELLKRLHLATGHFGLAQILKILKYMGWSKRIAADDVRAYGKWRCVICALCLAKRRAFHSVPVDATKPHPGKVWQMDQLEFRVGPPYYVNLFACVSCRVTVSLPHNTMTTDAIILTVGKLRALVRPYHGEIHIIKADSVSAVKARAFDDYAASETVDAGGASFNVQIAAGGIHEGVAMPEAAFGKYVPETLACLKHSGRAAKWAVKAFFDVENKHNSYVIHAGETKPPLQIFFEACDPPRSAPYCPLCIWGAPAAYTVDPLALTSKWEDRSKAGWYAGASRKACGPFGYSIADIITVHGVSIDVDWGMLKIYEEPIFARVDVFTNPDMQPVLPPPPDADMKRAATAPAPSPVPEAAWRAAQLRWGRHKATDADEGTLSHAVSRGVVSADGTVWRPTADQRLAAQRGEAIDAAARADVLEIDGAWDGDGDDATRRAARKARWDDEAASYRAQKLADLGRERWQRDAAAAKVASDSAPVVVRVPPSAATHGSRFHTLDVEEVATEPADDDEVDEAVFQCPEGSDGNAAPERAPVQTKPLPAPILEKDYSRAYDRRTAGLPRDGDAELLAAAVERGVQKRSGAVWYPAPRSAQAAKAANKRERRERGAFVRFDPCAPDLPKRPASATTPPAKRDTVFVPREVYPAEQCDECRPAGSCSRAIPSTGRGAQG